MHQPNSHQQPHAFKFIYATHTQELLATCCFTRHITKSFFHDGVLPNRLSRHDLAMSGPTATSRLMTPSLPTRLPANACRHLGPSIASHRLASHCLASRRRPHGVVRRLTAALPVTAPRSRRPSPSWPCRQLHGSLGARECTLGARECTLGERDLL